VAPLLVAERLQRIYLTGSTRVAAVDQVSLELARGEFVALAGPSGCGKSTLLHLCAAMDRPTSGQVTLEGTRLDVMSDDDMTRVRRTRIGFVFQFFNLLPTLTLLENVALPLMLSGEPAARALPKARALADRVGVGGRLHHFPSQLSGGEMQRAAIARALIHTPALVVADEPTGNLDSETGARVLALLTELNRESGTTLLLATHASEVASAADRIIHMRDGRIDRVEAGSSREGRGRDRGAL
jgi:putative ABC transport system ATP-binding protein